MAEVHNTKALGLLLYDQYFLLFQTAGLILLVAMIGAIVLTLRHRARTSSGRTCWRRCTATRPRRWN
jgi:hypothetical protein